MFILGISAYYHDSGACLLKDGEIIAAAQEERLLGRSMTLDSLRMLLIIACRKPGLNRVALLI